MGLDMYANRRAPRINEHLHYWRKHNRLIDIINLEKDILNNELPETEGFFFGMDSYEYTKEELKEQKEDDLQFIEEAKQAIEEGDEVVYSSWW